MRKKNLYEMYIAGEISHELSDNERREIMRRYYQECERIREIQRTWPHKDRYVLTKSLMTKVIPGPKPPPMPQYPEIIRGLTCGAKTRKGTPCKLPADAWGRSGRCKFHGGMSTGPKTEEGRKKSAENGKKPKKKRQITSES